MGRFDYYGNCPSERMLGSKIITIKELKLCQTKIFTKNRTFLETVSQNINFGHHFGYWSCCQGVIV